MSMDSYGSRASSSISLFATTVAIVAMLNALSVKLYPQSPSGSIQLGTVFDFTVHPYLKADQSNVDFHLKTDLSSAFQWNTKQLFVYVVATYKTPKNHRNEVIIWNRIVQRKEDALIDEKNILNDYPLRDQHLLLKDRLVNLTVAYRYMPIVGVITEHIVASSTFTTPKQYFYYNAKRHEQSSDEKINDDSEEDEDAELDEEQ